MNSNLENETTEHIQVIEEKEDNTQIPNLPEPEQKDNNEDPTKEMFHHEGLPPPQYDVPPTLPSLPFPYMGGYAAHGGFAYPPPPMGQSPLFMAYHQMAPMNQYGNPYQMRTEKPTHLQEFNAAESGGPGKPRQAPKRMKLNRRFMFNSLQKTILENEFANSNYPTNKRKEELAIDLGVKPNIIYNWFQNRRARKPYKYVLCVECKRKFSHPIEYEQENLQQVQQQQQQQQQQPPPQQHIQQQPSQIPIDQQVVYTQQQQAQPQQNGSQMTMAEERAAQLDYNQSMEYPPHPSLMQMDGQQMNADGATQQVMDPMHMPYHQPGVGMMGPPNGMPPHPNDVVTQAEMVAYHQQMMPLQPGSPIPGAGVGGALLPPMQQQQGYAPIPPLTSSPSPRMKVSSRLVTPKMSPMRAGEIGVSPRMMLPSPRLATPLGSEQILGEPSICSSPKPTAAPHSVTSLLEKPQEDEEGEQNLNQSI